jgi:hypothetical protein
LLSDFGRILIFAGGAFVLVGIILLLAGRIPGLGRLPGDIRIEREGFTFYAPLVTMLAVSVVLTLILNLIARFWR